jgi:hypothetical protein
MHRIVASGLALAIFLAACSAAPGATGTPPAAGTPAGSPASVPSFAIPSFDIPSFAPDTTLESAFPDTIDGEPVSDVTSGSFLALLQAIETDQALIDQYVAAIQGLGVNPALVSFASASATVDDETHQLQALRVPGGSAGPVVDVLTRIDPEEVPPTITQGSLGGKQVVIATDEDGDVDWFYINGEIAWFLSGMEEPQAEVILAALP